MFDGKQFAADVVSEVRGYVERSIIPIVARMDALEKQFSDLPAPRDGVDGAPGKDADTEAAAEIVAAKIAPEIEHLRSMLDAIPLPELPDIRAIVKDTLNAIEKPKDGHSPTPEELRPLMEECASRAVSALPAAKDGVGLAGSLIDRDGNLVVTLSDGSVTTLGPVVGKDGAPGKDGANGADGKDGRDGIGFDDMELVETEDGVFLRFTRGDIVKDFRLPIVIDRGVFKPGSAYRKGDGVTWGGSFWIAQCDTDEKPDTAKGWRLAVKKGRDGRDGKDATPVKVKV